MDSDVEEDKRVVLTLEVKKIISHQQEKIMTIPAIGEGMFREYQIRASRSTIYRKIKEILDLEVQNMD